MGTYVLGSSSIWTCWILNFHYNLFFLQAGAVEKIKTNIQKSKFDTSISMSSYQGHKSNIFQRKKNQKNATDFWHRVSALLNAEFCYCWNIGKANTTSSTKHQIPTTKKFTCLTINSVCKDAYEKNRTNCQWHYKNVTELDFKAHARTYLQPHYGNPPIHLHLIFEISSSKNLIRQTSIFAYFELDFCRLHRQ